MRQWLGKNCQIENKPGVIENEKPKVKTTHRVSPCARARGQITTRRIPLDVCDSIMIGTSQRLNAAAPLFLRCRLVHILASPNVLQIEIKVPKLQLRLRCRANCSEYGMPPPRRPSNRVTRPVGKALCNFSVMQQQQQQGACKAPERRYMRVEIRQ